MTSLTGTVVDSSDNGYGASTFLFTTHVAVASGTTGFIRFASLAIPQGATINAASFTAAWFVSRGATVTAMRGVAADNAAAPTTGAQLMSLPLTSASVSWSIPSTSAGGSQTSPSLASVLQEIVNRAGWASGNAATLIWTYTSGVGADVTSQSETLAITYTAAAPSTFTGSSAQTLPTLTQAAAGARTAPAFAATASQTLPAVTQSATAVGPFMVDATVDGTEVALSWEAQTGASGYAVERDGAIVAFGVAGTTYTDTPGDGDHTYRIGVLL